ncbi:hypothetical protein F5Y03DRAFT_350854 [Xylaria venustula]|nr:hypothetical protein F5Y03DRAFT_350854 [Xylaria venustula]
MASTMLNLHVTSPYSLPDWCKYLFMFTFPCWLALAIVGLVFVGPGYPVNFSAQFTSYSAPMSLLVDPKTAKVFTAMSALVVVINPFLTLLTWFVVPLVCLSRREDGHLRGGIAISFYGFLIAAMVVVVILGERVASAKPAFDGLLALFPELTLAEAQHTYNARIYQLRVGLAINISTCLFISFVQITLICFATFIPSSMKVPRRYEPTIRDSAAHQRQEEVPMLFSVIDNSTPVSGAIEDLFQLHEARWVELRRRGEVAIYESLATNKTPNNGSSGSTGNSVGHMAENTYTNTTADGTPNYTSDEHTAVDSLPQFENYQHYLKTSFPIRIWQAQWLSLILVLPNTFIDILLMLSAYSSIFSCSGQCIIETTGTYPLLATYLLGYEISRYYRKQKQRSWVIFMLTHVVLVAHSLAYMYGFVVYVVFMINFSARGMSHLGIDDNEIGGGIISVLGFIIKIPTGPIIFLQFLGNIWVYIFVYPQGPL